jgi:hypothetical protein
MRESIIFSLFGLVGAILLAWACQLIFFGLESETWPIADGVIIASRADTNISSEPSSRGVSFTDRADIAYQYTVDNQKMAGSAISFSYFYSSSNDEETSKFVRKYPRGKKVAVHYDPMDPHRAVLEPGIGWSNFILLAIGASLAFVGALPHLLRYAKQKRNSQHGMPQDQD